MAYQYTKGLSVYTNNPLGPTSLTGGENLFFNLKQALSGAGWNVPQWSDGVTLYSGGHTLTQVLQLTSSRAWIRIQMPSSSREFTFQRHNTAGVAFDNQWRVKYCPSGSFNTGASATQTPSATIETILCGAGTDASPTFGTPFGYGTSQTQPYTYHILVDNASPYGFCVWGYTTNNWYTPVRIFCDPLLAGSYPSNDPDPYVVCCENNTTLYGWGSFAVSTTQTYGLNSETTSYQGMQAFFGNPITSSAQAKLVSIPSMRVFGNNTPFIPRGIGTNTYTIKDEAPRAFYVRRAGAAGGGGYKGVSTLFRMGTTYRSIGETGTFSTNRDYIRIGDIWIVWDGTNGLT
jgi:hypothetical protein